MRHLFVTDGTADGTVLLKATGHDQVQSNTSAVFDGALYFHGEDVPHGRELWKTDGTVAGTMLVTDIMPGPESTGHGTSEGTRIVHDLNPGPGGSSPYDFAVEGDSLYFAASDGRIRALWQIQGRTVTRLADNAPTRPTPLPKGVVYVGPDERGVQRVWATGKGRRPVALTGNVFPPTASRD